MQTTDWVYEGMWVLKVKVISWPWPKAIYVLKLKHAFLRNKWAVFKQILFLSFWVHGNDFLYDAGHMNKMAAMPIYGKNPSKIFFTRTGWSISMKFGK